MIQYAKTCVHSVHSMDRGLQVFLGHVHVIRLHPSGCATALSHGKRALDTTKLLRVRAKALSCRRSRFRSSFATRTKRPAISAGAGEHSVHVSQGCASDPHKKWGSGLWAAGQHRGGMEARRRAWDALKCGGGGWFVPRLRGRHCAHLCANSRRCSSSAQRQRPP